MNNDDLMKLDKALNGASSDNYFMCSDEDFNELIHKVSNSNTVTQSQKDIKFKNARIEINFTKEGIAEIIKETTKEVNDDSMKEIKTREEMARKQLNELQFIYRICEVGDPFYEFFYRIYDANTTITESQRDFVHNQIKTLIYKEINEHQRKFKTPIKIRVWEYGNNLNMTSNDSELLRMILKSINEDTNIPDHNSDATEIKSNYVNKMYEANVCLYKFSSSLKGFELEYVHPKEHYLRYSDLHFGMMSISSLINYCIGKLDILTNKKTIIEARYSDTANNITILSNNKSLLDNILILVLSNIYNINIVGYSESSNVLILNFDKDDQEYKKFRSFICAYTI